MAPEDEPRWGVCEHLAHSELRDRLGSGSFYALNALCVKLAEMTAWESTAFEGLVEARKGEAPIPLDTLIDFAYGARQCHVVPARTDAELGRFYVDNGFVPEADDLPEEVVKLLDFVKIGEDKLLTYKAVLEAAGFATLDRALDVARHIDEYSLAPEQDSAIARRELRVSLGEREAKALLPNIDLYRYGQALREREQFALTGYGRVQRADCQPLLAQAPQEQQMARGAMTMQQTM